MLRGYSCNFERLDILLDSIGHPTQKLLSFEFGQRFYFQIRASRYITGFNLTFELKVIVVWICYKVTFAILSALIYYWTQSDIRLKSYCRLNLLRASVQNFERVDILRDSIGHQSKKLLWLEIPTSFRLQLRASRYIMGINRTSELKVFVVCIWASILNFEHLDILWDIIGHPS